MTVLTDYTQFDGLHWETGSVRNYLDYIGVIAPHTREPYSEALLMGICGGIVMGYFSFAYEGYDPQARILTRNTFEPLDRLLERLGVVQNIRQTANPDKALRHLAECLENGQPALAWADMYSLPYNALQQDTKMWAMMPILVFGFDKASGQVWIADRARHPLSITLEELAAARNRAKNARHRLLTLEPPNPETLATAVRKGIWDTIKLYLETPPKGSRNNFGLTAYVWWAELLRKPKARMSWEREFPAGRKMYAGLCSAFYDINIFGKEGHAERDVYAAFLEEASLILEKPALQEAADRFRRSAHAWDQLSMVLLPDEVEPFGETRKLMSQRHRLFLEQGTNALQEIQDIDARLEQIRKGIHGDYPLDAAGVIDHREKIANCVMDIHDCEKIAVEGLQEVMESKY